MSVPAKQNIAHYRGDTLALLLRLFEDDAQTAPSDLAAATVTAQVRATTEATVVLAEFAVAVDGNEVALRLSPEKSRTLPVTAVYDVQVDWASDDVNVQTVLSGQLISSPDVTRAVVP